MRSKFQFYETETISRALIKNAPYNPRIMDKDAKKRLQKSIREHGLVSALTWNRRTGNLVGGHQRLEQLDALEKTQNYELTVCVVDVDEREEAALNVQLNNPSMQGDWDLDKLANLSEDFEFSMEELGFSQRDAEFLFEGDDRFTALYETPESNEMKGKLKEIKKAREAMTESNREKARIDFYSVIVFASPEERREFYREISVPENEEYITPDMVRRLSGA